MLGRALSRRDWALSMGKLDLPVYRKEAAGREYGCPPATEGDLGQLLPHSLQKKPTLLPWSLDFRTMRKEHVCGVVFRQSPQTSPAEEGS